MFAWALLIRAARDLLIPFFLSASYVFGFLIEEPCFFFPGIVLTSLGLKRPCFGNARRTGFQRCAKDGSGPGSAAAMRAYLVPMSLLIMPSTRTNLRRMRARFAEEPHFDALELERVVHAFEREARRAPGRRLLIRSDVARFKVADARRMLAGLPAPGDYRVVIKPLRYRTRPSLSALCEFDLGRIILRLPEPFRPFDELVYYGARRKRGGGMRFAWVSEKVRFRTRRDVLRFLYCHEWLHWYLREMQGLRSGAETACDRFALRNFRRRQVTVADAREALRGCRMQPLPDYRLAA